VRELTRIKKLDRSVPLLTKEQLIEQVKFKHIMVNTGIIAEVLSEYTCPLCSKQCCFRKVSFQDAVCDVDMSCIDPTCGACWRWSSSRVDSKLNSLVIYFLFRFPHLKCTQNQNRAKTMLYVEIYQQFDEHSSRMF
jgi:hypothetical protein